MLGVTSVRSAAGAAAYFANDNYYTAEDSAEASGWGGEGAARLGLVGQVEKEAFEKILTGELPSGERVGQVERRQSGMDLTFSMPKSASIMAYIAGDARVLAANMQAVRATMAWVEKNLAEGRTDVDGRKVPIRTGNLVYALFQHDTSRAIDPQAHIHAVIANLTRMPDGRIRALHNGAIWRANTTIGAVYHAYLRTNLEQLGYVIERAGKHGAFEIAGVPRAIVEAFSQRREVILEKAKELGLVSAQARDLVAVTTRDPKSPIGDRTAMRAGWRAKAAALGFDGRTLLVSARATVAQLRPDRPARGFQAMVAAVERGKEFLGDLLRPHDPLVDRMLIRSSPSPEDARAQLAVASAVRILAQREAAFATTQLIKTALDLGLQGVTAGSVDRRIERLVATGQLVRGAPRYGDLVTTREALRTEEEILARVAAGHDRSVALLSSAVATARLQAEAAMPLTPGQLAAATLIVGSTDQVVLVQGVAGAGKSTMLQAVARVAEREGRRVVGLAFQNKMVADLGQSAGIPSGTIAGFLQAHERFVSEQSGPHFTAARAAFAHTLLVVDETSMVSSDDMLKLLKIAEVLDVEKLALVGDRQQLASIDAGKAFALLQAGGGATARMDENLRQRTEQLRTVAALANRGAAGAAIQVLGGAVVESFDPAAHAADLWLALSESDRAQTSMFASGRAVRAIINQRVQDGLAAEGRLVGEGIRLQVFERLGFAREELRHASSYRPGHVLEVNQRLIEVGLQRGQYEVLGVDRHGIVTLGNGRQRQRFDPLRLSPTHARDRLTLAERKEVHLRQGETIRWTATDKARGLNNSALARVLTADASGLLVESARGDRLMLTPGDTMLERLDLAYSLNMHMAQGITTDRAIVVMTSTERLLSSQRLFNVAVTRVRDQLTLVVDDRAMLERQLDRTTGDKTSALETVGRIEIDHASDPRPASVKGEINRWSDSPQARRRLVRSGGGATAARALEERPLPDVCEAAPPLPERKLGLGL